MIDGKAMVVFVCFLYTHLKLGNCYISHYKRDSKVKYEDYVVLGKYREWKKIELIE